MYFLPAGYVLNRIIAPTTLKVRRRAKVVAATPSQGQCWKCQPQYKTKLVKEVVDVVTTWYIHHVFLYRNLYISSQKKKYHNKIEKIEKFYNRFSLASIFSHPLIHVYVSMCTLVFVNLWFRFHSALIFVVKLVFKVFLWFFLSIWLHN